MDALSEVLGHIRLKDAKWAWSVASAPWGISLRESRNGVRFHYVAKGSCWLSIGRGTQRLSAGDLAIVAHGHAHAVGDRPGTPSLPFDQLMVHSTALESGVRHQTFGGGGAESIVVCGMFVIDSPLVPSILASLPPVFRLAPEGTIPAFLHNVQFIANEIESNRAGSQLVLTRMADVVFVQLLRAYVESLPNEALGALGALHDKHLGAALALMHRRLDEPWTVAALAREVGLSRSGFAARFAAHIGETPLAYLAGLRMQRASTLLREGATIARAAHLTGYSSEASFSHAFRQWAGIAPGAYRRSNQPLDKIP